MPLTEYRDTQSAAAAAPRAAGRLAITVLLACALALRLAFFAVSVTHLQPSADESITCLQAWDVLHGKIPLLLMSQPYLFPLESYLATPFAAWLPPNALGARLVSLLIHLLAIAVSLVLLRRVFPHRVPWAGLLLILFPSSYFVLMQSAYALPGYSSLPLLGALCLLGVILQRAYQGRRAWALAFLVGITGGLMVTSHMLALSLIAAAALYLCLGTGWRAALRNVSGFIPGVLVGLAPYLAARVLYPGSYGVVSQTYPLAQALGRLWSPLLKYTVSITMGLRTVLYPDNDWTTLVPIPLSAARLVWVALIGGLLVWRVWAGLRRTVRRRWPSLDARDLFVVVAVLTLAAFALNRRADSRSYRYLLPLLWAFPFLVEAVIGRVRSRWGRPVALGLVGVYAAWNMGTTGVVMSRWCQPDFAAREAGVADLRPALDRLHALGIRHAVASYGVAYRINYQSGGRILCSQPSNERFPGWPVAFKQDVDADTNVAYVLTDTVRFLKPDIFDRHLRTMGVEADRDECGEFVVYHAFRPVPPRDTEQPAALPAGLASASHNSADARNLLDGSEAAVWTSRDLQQANMWVQVEFGNRMPVSAIRLVYGRFFHDHAPRMDLMVSTEDHWVYQQVDIRPELDKFVFRNGHPIYGMPESQTLRFPPRMIYGFRLLITEPNPAFCWTLADIEVLRQP